MKTTILIAVIFIGFTSTVAAQTQWQKNHPRRTEVNQRLVNENRRINKEVKEGDMSKEEAKDLKKDLKNIHKEEKVMASKHAGHLTKGEQKRLNKQENQVSKEIGK